MNRTNGNFPGDIDAVRTADGYTLVYPSETPDIAAQIDARNGWVEPGEQPSDRDQSFGEAGELLRWFAIWISESGTLQAAGIRALALSFILRPGAFDSISQRELADRFGLTKQAISKYVTQIYKLANGIFQTGCLRGAEVRRKKRLNALNQHRRKNQTKRSGDES